MALGVLEPMMKSNKEVAVIWLLSIAIGFLVLAAPVQFLMARHAASFGGAVSVLARPGRKGLS
jgi:hypothetical protein